MTFPLDPGVRAFQAEDAEHVLLPDPAAPPVPPESFQAEAEEHSRLTPSDPEVAAAPPTS
jgi:hypothetical protein